MTDWKALENAEDHAYFMADLMDISPESFTLEEKKQILRDMIESSTAIENAMRDEFAELDEVTQTRLIDDLAADGPRSRNGGTRCSWTAPGTATSRRLPTARAGGGSDGGPRPDKGARASPCVDLREAMERYGSSLPASQSSGTRGSAPRRSSIASAVATPQRASSRVTTGSRSRGPARRRRASPSGAFFRPRCRSRRG